MIGDGNYTRGVAPTISVNTEELYEYLNSNFDIGISKLRAEKSGNVYAQVYFRGKEIQTHLEELGIYGQVKEGKRLPDNIGTYCREDICEMIGGYFDADGNVQIVRSGPIIKLTCKYKEMLEQVRYLLLQLGVISSIHAERMGGSVLKSSVNNKV
jgi:intein/homing endonuclease